MVKRLVIVCFVLLLTGCGDNTNDNMLKEFNRLEDENKRMSEKVIELENKITLLFDDKEQREREKAQQKAKSSSNMINFTFDMKIDNDYPSNSNMYRVVVNAEGTYLVDENYKPLERITNAAMPTENCWSKNDENVMLFSNIEWYSEYFVYTIEMDQMTKLFEKDDFVVTGEYSYDNEYFGYISRFVMWLDDSKMIFVAANGEPKDGSEAEYRERGYRSDVFVYDWKTRELMRLTDAEDGEYYECNGVDTTETMLMLTISKIDKESNLVEEKNIELPYRELVY